MPVSDKVNVLKVEISSGSGAPTHIAPRGSLYLNTAGSGVADRAYINTLGTGVWTAVSTVA